MRNQYLVIILLLLLSLLSACAVLPGDDEEGGITGSGHTINCKDKKNKLHKLCIEKKPHEDEIH